MFMPPQYPPDRPLRFTADVDFERRRPHAGPLAEQFLEFDLNAEIARLRGETIWSTGRNARTLVKYQDFRVVLSTLRAGLRVTEHQTDGRVSIQVVSGRLRLNAAGRTFDLRPGGLLSLDQRQTHDLEALEDCAFLLTMAWPGRQVAQQTQT